MTTSSFPACQPRSYADIEREAAKARQVIGIPSTGRVPHPQRLLARITGVTVAGVGSLATLAYNVADLSPGREAATEYLPDAGEIEISLSPKTYGELLAGNGRALFSLGHELGHAFMHVQELAALERFPEARVALYRGEFAGLRPFRDVEWQAEAFSAAFLMPAGDLEQLRRNHLLCPRELVRRYGVSWAAARKRISKFDDYGEKMLATTA